MNIKRAFILVMAGVLLPAGALMAQAGTRATIDTTKSFSDESSDVVHVTLTCNTGDPLMQEADISPGAGVEFVVTDFQDGELDCEVTESGGPDGYTADYDCDFENINDGDELECEIENVADDARFTLYKEWVISENGNESVVDDGVWLYIYCNAEIRDTNGTIYESEGSSYPFRTQRYFKGDGNLFADVDVEDGQAACYAREYTYSSAVEQTWVGCQSGYPVQLGPGSSFGCTITNTVFYEGIPTLSQYGLAILVLLTLGVGFVGFRRFV